MDAVLLFGLEEKATLLMFCCKVKPSNRQNHIKSFLDMDNGTIATSKYDMREHWIR